MGSLVAFITIISLAAFAFASTQASDAPFQVTNLTIRKVAMANTTLEFTVFDPDPLANTTQLCTGSWKAGSKDFPEGSYEPCGNSTLGWNVQSFDSLRSFVLGIEHSFMDPSIGEAPYNWISNFGEANITSPSISCKTTSGLFLCEQAEDTVINAPIYATDAKR